MKIRKWRKPKPTLTKNQDSKTVDLPIWLSTASNPKWTPTASIVDTGCAFALVLPLSTLKGLGVDLDKPLTSTNMIVADGTSSKVPIYRVNLIVKTHYGDSLIFLNVEAAGSDNTEVLIGQEILSYLNIQIRSGKLAFLEPNDEFAELDSYFSTKLPEGSPISVANAKRDKNLIKPQNGSNGPKRAIGASPLNPIKKPKPPRKP